MIHVKLKQTLLSLLLLSAMVLTGCSDHASISKVVDFDQERDLSIYYTQSKEDSTKKTVELKSTLEYVDTAYLMRLKLGNGEVSTTRKTYQESPKDWDFVLIDARRADMFEQGHINGAINIPDAKFDQAKSLLPKNKNTLLIFYGDGLTCELSSNSAEKAKKLGFKNVKVYQEGIPAWTNASNYLAVTGNYTKHHIMEVAMINDDKQPAAILDVRPYAKYFETHIPNAVNVDETNFAKKFTGTVPQKKNTEIIIYCDGFSCGSSYLVAEGLIGEGYTNVKVYAGGIQEWNTHSFPTFGTKGRVAGFNVSEGVVERALTPDEFEKELKTDKAIVLDVRRDDEVAAGYIKGSIHIPHTKILADSQHILGKLPEDKNTTILIHCKSGVRAGSVVNHVAALGYNNTFFLDNGITITKDGKYTYDVVRALTPEEFDQKLASKNVKVLDVRGPDEVAEGHIKGSIHIPHTEILDDPQETAKKLPKDKNATILIHCKSGVRAGSVIDTVVELGYNNAYFLDHAITIAKDGKHTFE